MAEVPKDRNESTQRPEVYESGRSLGDLEC